MELPTRFHYIQKELTHVEDILKKWISDTPLIIKEPALQLVNAGGKRIRPLLVLTSNYYVKAEQEKVYHLAAVFELIHIASLIHDDIIDDTDRRRGQPTLHRTHDRFYAINVANFLFSMALRKLTEIPSKRLHRSVSHLLVDLTNGELTQLTERYQFNPSLRNYLKTIKKKTAHFLGVSMQATSMLLDQEHECETTLYTFGYYFGMAYQIQDDLMNFNTDNQTKTTHNDLIDGYLTLPTILALNDKKIYDKVQQLFSGTMNLIDYDQLIIDIKMSEAFNQSIQFKQRYLLKATEQLKFLPNRQEAYIYSSLIASLNRHRF